MQAAGFTVQTLDVESMYQAADFTMLALDIEAFHGAGRDLAVRKRLRTAMRMIVERSLKGVPLHSRSQATILDRGDGMMVLLPASVTPIDLLLRVVPHLAECLDSYNDEAEPTSVMRLRLVIHAGQAIFDDGGFIGDELTYTFRLLDSEMMRRRLATTAQPIALAVSSRVRQEVEAATPAQQASIPQLGSLAFKNKETEGLAWTATLGRCVPHGTPV
ncbi:hypothetical protein [Micromonospora endolithica]|uniref:Guanylate cyclase domain-containing protein n=1 Tax=Micromonospora endolithica TaxID=230091 RepID=A0A3A9ZJ37_9ACTN|nr:hypothetical protein [Micromonospora endolithica]RKN48412.1 hypothetical protein D7223_10435 [Micromonospora endolithica]TWJ24514.1 hypothetical protein JD76_04665 [Micromonospora endolithica]